MGQGHAELGYLPVQSPLIGSDRSGRHSNECALSAITHQSDRSAGTGASLPALPALTSQSEQAHVPANMQGPVPTPGRLFHSWATALPETSAAAH